MCRKGKDGIPTRRKEDDSHRLLFWVLGRFSNRQSLSSHPGCDSNPVSAAAWQLVNMGGHLDYLVSDYLAEITMCILARAKSKVRHRTPTRGNQLMLVVLASIVFIDNLVIGFDFRGD